MSASRKVIVILDKAHIEVIGKNKECSILNPDYHLSLIRKSKRDPSDIRPDILFQCLRVLQESPLNRAGYLKVIIRTKQNLLIEVSNQLRVPLSFENFSKLMVKLHSKLRVNAKEKFKHGQKRLLKIVKNQVNLILPADAKKIGFSHKAKEIVKPEFLIPKDGSLVVVIGAMAHGSVTDSCDFLDDVVSISHFPLSGALACAEIIDAAASVWDIENPYLDE